MKNLTPKYAKSQKTIRKSRRTRTLEEALEFQVPALPHHVRTVIALGTAREINAAHLARAIQRDYGMSLRLYRVLNSAFFSPGRQQVLSMRFITVLLGQDNLVRTIASTPTLSIKQPETVKTYRYALIMMAQALAAAEISYFMADNYNMKPEKVVPCTMLRTLGHLILSFISVAASQLVFENLGSREDKQIKRFTGWFPEELGVMLATRWNLPELIVKAQYKFNDIKKSLSGEDSQVLLLAHSIMSIIILSAQRKSSERQQEIHQLMIKKLGVSQKGISKAFQEGIKDFKEHNPFFYDILEGHGLLDNLML